MFENSKRKMRNLLILGTNKSLSLCNDGNCKQFFVDSTYRAVPSNSEFKHCVMITYNLKNKLYELVNIALLEDETEETYNEYYSILKNKYSFTPKIITVDYALSNINSIKKAFDSKNTLILTCNFHFVQAIWRNYNKIGLRKKNIVH